MRLFFDTNVLASALTARGLCAELYEETALDHQIIIGKPVLEELLRVLADKLHVPPNRLAKVRAILRQFEQASASDTHSIYFPDDPTDAPILACAVTAKVDFFITGDKALLALGNVENIPIVSPRQLWQKLYGLNDNADL